MPSLTAIETSFTSSLTSLLTTTDTSVLLMPSHVNSSFLPSSIATSTPRQQTGTTTTRFYNHNNTPEMITLSIMISYYFLVLHNPQWCLHCPQQTVFIVTTPPSVTPLPSMVTSSSQMISKPSLPRVTSSQ